MSEAAGARGAMARPRIEVRRSARRRRTLTAYREADSIVVLVPASLPAADERRLVDQLVDKVLARESLGRAQRADDLLARAVALSERYLAPSLGRVPTPTSVTWVGNQQRRWGSCTTSTGAIRLSDRLRDLPDWVVDAVLLHELAHLVEPGHGPSFRGLLAAYPYDQRARGFLEGIAYARGLSIDPDEDAD